MNFQHFFYRGFFNHLCDQGIGQNFTERGLLNKDSKVFLTAARQEYKQKQVLCQGLLFGQVGLWLPRQKLGKTYRHTHLKGLLALTFDINTH